jgi:hypothetical protein
MRKYKSSLQKRVIGLANYRKKIWQLKPRRCRLCDPDVQRSVVMHHPDYRRPYMVIWLCRRHHQIFHAMVKQQERLRATPSQVINGE